MVWKARTATPIPAEFIHPESFVLDDWQESEAIESAEILASWATRFEPETDDQRIKVYESDQFSELERDRNARNCWSISWTSNGDQILWAGLHDPELEGSSDILGFLITAKEWQDGDNSPEAQTVAIEKDFECDHFDDETIEDDDDCPKCFGNGCGSIYVAGLIELQA